MKRFLHYCNAALTLITMILGLFTGDEAIMSYSILGLYQLALGFVYLCYALFYKHEMIANLFYYWLAVIAYIGIVKFYYPNRFIFLFLPLCIASYHCYLTYLISDPPKTLIHWYKRKFTHS